MKNLNFKTILYTAIFTLTSCATNFNKQKYTHLSNNQNYETISQTKDSTITLFDTVMVFQETIAHKETHLEKFQREVFPGTLDTAHFIHQLDCFDLKISNQQITLIETQNTTQLTISRDRNKKLFQSTGKKIIKQKSHAQKNVLSALSIVLIVLLVIVGIIAVFCAYIIWLLLFSWW